MRKMRQIIFHKYNSFIITLIICIFVVPLQATMWITTKKNCPISGEEISVSEVVSYGSYIYDSPSKYDMVFWPMTDEEWIWLNPNNGYAAFGSDFEKISDEEKTKLKQWLADNYTAAQEPNSYTEKLLWLEKVYSQRDMDDDFWCQFYRLMAYIYRDNELKSMEYVRKALPLLDKILLSNPEGTERIQTLFLLGEYNRRTGDKTKAKKYFTLARKAEYKDEDGKIRKGHPYIVGLINDIYPSKLNSIKIIGITIIPVLIIIFIALYIYKSKKLKINKVPF